MDIEIKNKKESRFQKIVFKIFACPFFLLAFITLANFLILGKSEYKFIGWQMIVLLMLIIYWVVTSGEKFRLKLLIQK